jgi:hypothetical protein
LRTFFFERKIAETSPFRGPVSTAPGLLGLVEVKRPLGANESVDISLAASWDCELDWNDILYKMQTLMSRAFVRDEDEQEIKIWYILYIRVDVKCGGRYLLC